jgi:hypothetical protein
MLIVELKVQKLLAIAICLKAEIGQSIELKRSKEYLSMQMDAILNLLNKK